MDHSFSGYNAEGVGLVMESRQQNADFSRYHIHITVKRWIDWYSVTWHVSVMTCSCLPKAKTLD